MERVLGIFHPWAIESMRQNTIIVIKNDEGASLVDHCEKVPASWSCLKNGYLLSI